MKEIRINDCWEFVPAWSEAFLKGEGQGQAVRLPHNVKEMPLHYADPADYQMICGYRRKLFFDPAEKDRRHFIRFDAAAHIAEVWFNNTRLGEHRNGYTAFTFELTDLVDYENDNMIAVKLDTTENSSVPPFGFVIDYLTYGGIYRDVWQMSAPQAYITDVFVRTPALSTVEADIETEGSGMLDIRILDDEKAICLRHTRADARGKATVRFDVENVQPWEVHNGKLYVMEVTMGEDVKRVSFGFRTIRIEKNRLLINEKEVFIRGLNRHQSWPYAGYAVPEALQREDARILDEELHVNAVRTSHYPQSHYFIDECDRRGILVFTEIPGWQHLGDDVWKNQAVENTKEMIREYRNHPSIILWGVRINESVDDDELYERTNAAAHELDPSRPTSGVRYLEKSSLLEDVYGYNDFSHNGTNAGCRKKKDVTPDMAKPLLITEANGHMFPTKSFDHWEKRQEHALRHARVLDAAMRDGEHIGCFQWCMFDYQTHKDFGSGDRICYHGVMDQFRNPKLAAAVYASQTDGEAVLEIGSPMDIGDYAGGHIDEIYAFTNADEVRLYKNDDYVASFTSKGWKGLQHGPVMIDDTIGCLLETKEGFEPKKAKLIHDALAAAGKYGITNLPLKNMAQLAWCMAHYKMKYEEGVELYGKYVGSWGGGSTEWRFEAVRNGKPAKSVTKSPRTKLHLEVKASHTELLESDAYDMAAVRIRVLDDLNNTASYAQVPIMFETEGDIELAGASAVTVEGGMCGTYIRTKENGKEGTLTIRAEGMGEQRIVFTIHKG